MFATVTKKFEVALNGGLDGTRKYWPGDVAEDRHAEIGIEMGRAEEIDPDDANQGPSGDKGGSDDDVLTLEDLQKMRTHADLDDVADVNDLAIDGFNSMSVADKKAALIAVLWPNDGEKGTTPSQNKSVAPPENKST